jgi:hypothetical protein
LTLCKAYGNMSPMKQYVPLSEQLRKAILSSDKSRYVISRETGVGQDTLSLFVNHKRGLSLKATDKIGECLGLQIVTLEDKHRIRGN